MIRYPITAGLFFISINAMGGELSLSYMRSAVGGICPADLSKVTIIDANDRCDPHLSISKACDAKYSAPGSEWHQCYEQISECRRQVDQENQTVYDYNDWIAKCTAARANRNNSVQSPRASAKGGTNSTADDFAARLEEAKIRNKQMEEVNGKQQQAFSQELERRRQDNYLRYVRDIEEARREEARLREQYRIERDQMRQAQLMRQLEQQQEARATAEAVLGSFLQGFISTYRVHYQALPTLTKSHRLPLDHRRHILLHQRKLRSNRNRLTHSHLA